MLWRVSDRKVDSFMRIIGWNDPLPKSMLDTFLELDNIYDRMERKRMEDEAEKNKNKGNK